MPRSRIFLRCFFLSGLLFDQLPKASNIARTCLLYTSGLARLLPPPPEDQDQQNTDKIKERNVLQVYLNKDDALTVSYTHLVKKSPKADLEGKKSTWLLVGYVVVLAFMFVAFEWTQRDVKIDTSQAVADVVFEEEIIPITETPEQQAPPPPEAPKVAELLEIVDDKAEIDETTTIINEDNAAPVEVKYVPVQVVEEEPEEQTIFEVVENMPDFPGGQAALMQYLAKNIKYPTIAQENGTQGRVIVQFVVNKDGSIVDAKVVRSVDPYLDKEALRVINTMPKWKPGMQRGKPVRVKFTVPVMFRLQ